MKKEFNAEKLCREVMDHSGTLNCLKVDHAYKFYESSKWVRGVPSKYIVETQDDIPCDVRKVAASVINHPTSIKNQSYDEKFWCLPGQAYLNLIGEEVELLMDHVSEDQPNFPEILVIAILPMGYPTDRLDAFSPEIIRDIEEYLGMSKGEIMERFTWIPIVKRIERGEKKGLLEPINSFLVEIVN